MESSFQVKQKGPEVCGSRLECLVISGQKSYVNHIRHSRACSEHFGSHLEKKQKLPLNSIAELLGLFTSVGSLLSPAQARSPPPSAQAFLLNTGYRTLISCQLPLGAIWCKNSLTNKNICLPGLSFVQLIPDSCSNLHVSIYWMETEQQETKGESYKAYVL